MGIFDFILNRDSPNRQPHPLIVHNNQYFKEISRERSLLDCEFTVIDTELTGLNPKKDEVIAIGGVRVRDLRICCGETFYALVKPQGRFFSESTVVHRITPHELEEAQPLEEVLPRFLEFCGDSFLVGHYVRLDIDFINMACKRLLGGRLRTPYLDTMRLAMAYNELKHGHYYDHYNLGSSYNLTALTKEYDLPAFDEHNAMQDSVQAAYLFLYLVRNMRGHGLRTMDDFLKAGRKWKIIL